MAWLRIDDRFASHPKIGELSDREFRVHVRVLCYCALHQTGGSIPASAYAEVPGLTRTVASRLVQLGLWDEDSQASPNGKPSLTVHDWCVYNPTDPSNAERQRRHRDRHRDAESDGDGDAK